MCENMRDSGEMLDDIQGLLEYGETLVYWDEEQQLVSEIENGARALFAGLVVLYVAWSLYPWAIENLNESRYGMAVFLLVILFVGLALLVLGFLNIFRPRPNRYFITDRRLYLRTVNFLRLENVINILPESILTVSMKSESGNENSSYIISAMVRMPEDSHNVTCVFTPKKDAQLMLDALKSLRDGQAVEN